MTYRVEFTPQAAEDLALLDPPTARRVSSKIHWLSEHLDRLTPEPLGGRYPGLCKLRIGDWRVLYAIGRAQAVITVHLIGHRSKVYKL